MRHIQKWTETKSYSSRSHCRGVTKKTIAMTKSTRMAMAHKQQPISWSFFSVNRMDSKKVRR